jgi:glycerate-2-kinase
MFIKNYEALAISPLRKDAIDIVAAGIEAADPEAALRRKTSFDGTVFTVGKKKFDISSYKNIYVVGGGKAAFRGAKFLESVLKDRITDGVILDVKVGKLKKIKCYEGTHPFPSKENMEATDELVNILKKADRSDLVIALVSGGGSALLCKPEKLTCADIKNVTEEFFRRGADIKEINIVRKHISNIHGGHLAKHAYPADVLGLIFSDIPFSDISFVASGPTFMDKTTKADAAKVAKKYGMKNMSFMETPKDAKYFKNVSNELILSNKDALTAMAAEAKKRGYDPKICGSCLKGEAKKLAPTLIKKFSFGKKTALIAGGETTVVIKKEGKGGRNLEVSMGAIGTMPKNSVIFSMASDGKDHIKGVGGGLVDDTVIKKAEELGYDPGEFLKNNMSYKFLKDTGGLVLSKRTGTNVSDLMVMLKD